MGDFKVDRGARQPKLLDLKKVGLSAEDWSGKRRKEDIRSFDWLKYNCHVIGADLRQAQIELRSIQFQETRLVVEVRLLHPFEVGFGFCCCISTISTLLLLSLSFPLSEHPDPRSSSNHDFGGGRSRGRGQRIQNPGKESHTTEGVL